MTPVAQIRIVFRIVVKEWSVSVYTSKTYCCIFRVLSLSVGLIDTSPVRTIHRDQELKPMFRVEFWGRAFVSFRASNLIRRLLTRRECCAWEVAISVSRSSVAGTLICFFGYLIMLRTAFCSVQWYYDCKWRIESSGKYNLCSVFLRATPAFTWKNSGNHEKPQWVRF